MVKERSNYTDIWNQWLQADAYDSNQRINKEIEENIDFYEGKHWGYISENAKTRYLPRPVINLVELVANTKISALDAGKTKLQYQSYSNPDKAVQLTRFVNYTLDEMGFENIKREHIFDGVVKGNAAFHVYWDNEARQTVLGYKGGIVIETLDPRNVKFANPKLRDIQKNEWIIIKRTMSLEQAKALAKDKAQINLIHADDEDNENIDGILPVLTKYYKKRDKNTGIMEVWFQHSAKNTLIGEPTRIANPVHEQTTFEQYDKSKVSYLEDGTSELPSEPVVRKANLYPISFFSYARREKNIKGRSIITDMIPNQRAINFNLAMMLVAVQNNAWGQRVVKHDALKGQELTNDPSQVIVDHSQGQGIYSLQTQPFSSSALALNQAIIDLVRIITGTTEVMTGEQKGGMSGVAIATLQERAQKTIDSLVKEYRACLTELGRIIEMFVSIFYDQNERRTYYYEEDDNVVQTDFIGTEMSDTDFAVTVVATNGSQYSEAVELQLLQDLFINKAIDFETYLKNIPDQLFPNKEKILSETQESLSLQLEQQVMANQQMQQAMQKMSELMNRIEPILNENASLKGKLVQIYNEASAKIAKANQVISETDKAAMDLASQAVRSGANGMSKVQDPDASN